MATQNRTLLKEKRGRRRRLHELWALLAGWKKMNASKAAFTINNERTQRKICCMPFDSGHRKKENKRKADKTWSSQLNYQITKVLLQVKACLCFSQLRGGERLRDVQTAIDHQVQIKEKKNFTLLTQGCQRENWI